jgi:hypothetical protein
MVDDPRTEHLREWNRLARENAENAIVSSMFEGAFRANEPIDKFATWLLIGAAAVASFLIANADALLPIINQRGFFVCGVFLCLSCVLGLLSKMYGLRCKVNIEVSDAIRKTSLEHFRKYEEEEEKIEQGAKHFGINLETGIRMDRVLSEFFAPLPKWVTWIGARQLKKYEGNPQVGYIPIVRTLHKQGVFAFLQALSFLGFLIAGFVFAVI